MKFWIDPYIYSAMSSKDKELINKFKFDDFRNKDRFKDIKDVYISITKAKKVNLNRSSMLMASFFPRRICQQGCICPGQDCQDIFTFLPNGFVCSGDYPISTPEISKTIQEHYADEQTGLKEMLLPHHGGNNCCNYMPFDFIEAAYAQNPRQKRFNHPGNITIDNLRKWSIAFTNIQEAAFDA